MGDHHPSPLEPRSLPATCAGMTDPHINIVFDGPPGPEGGRFVEIEDAAGRSITLGEWIERDDGLWTLRIGLAEIVDRLGDAAKA
jgi:hypothetical protein